ncbi:helix-turn-helix transcriptional regulator [Streptomyces sp. S1D4-20]|uniref:helix-turn-helix domain-containing protein n=1 Tax=Streptomyces sp. S1D4-20 TaxID=2594462 RepID=UPI00116392C3|nr:helix-turn-helix transcriptional regulator [Streptomyces sp. S1D4-20]QDN54256.1 helix-turn-helix domain-containing protein [Streptomyces sp. S1D4-20]
MTEAKSAPTVLQMLLGRRLAALRDAAGLTAAQASLRIRSAPTTVTRMEKAETALNFAKVTLLLDSYGVSQREKDEFLELLDKAGDPGWWQGFRDALPSWFGVHVSLETAATHIRSYEPAVVHGLLQTADYARAVLERGLPRIGPDVLERRVNLRTKRQELLTRTDPASPPLWVIMDETCLRRPVGDRDMMAAQIDHLLEMTDLPNVSLQICPLEKGLHPGAFSPFSIFRFEIPELPDVVCIDTLSGATYSEEKDEVALFREALDQMSVYALSRDATKQFIGDIRKELCP